MSRIQQLEEFIRETPNDPFLHYALVMEYVKVNDLEKSKAGFENMISKYPEYVGTYYHFGKLLEKIDNKEEAIIIYQKGIDVAKRAKNMHAMGELQGALNFLIGFDDDDDEY